MKKLLINAGLVGFLFLISVYGNAMNSPELVVTSMSIGLAGAQKAQQILKLRNSLLEVIDEFEKQKDTESAYQVLDGLMNVINKSHIMMAIFSFPVIQKKLAQALENQFTDQALHATAIFNLPKAAIILLDKGVDANAQDSDRYTPLDIAIIKDYKEIAQVLLDKGARSCINDATNKKMEGVKISPEMKNLLAKYPNQCNL